MLSAEERQEIEAERALYPNPQALAIDAMRILQKRRGWISDEAVRDVAELLGMTADEVDSVATFYNHLFRKPVGRHVIFVCDSVSCWVMGYERTVSHLTGRLGIRLGETTPDGRFTLLPIVCLGACDRAPAMMVDDELYGDLTPARMDEILARYA
ncbi:MAG: NADH-quinone oxidoreductase subunit NuoE [bacterium]